MTKQQFRPYNPDQSYLLPPSMKDWLPEDDLVYFMLDVVNQLDIRSITRRYDNSRGGQPGYHPKMMVSLLLYGYCMGIFSSRKIEQATYHQIPFRVLTGDQHPDHDTIADFRKRHLKALSALFVQVLQLCRKAGLVKLGHVSLDGTKVRANASKHKAMSYGRMEKKARELEQDVKDLMARAEATDIEEDKTIGKGKRGDELPKDLQFKQSRLAKIKEAMAALEEEARKEADEKRKAIKQQDAKMQAEGRKRPGRKPKPPSDKPEEKAQRNFTDPDSRIMKDGATKSFEQSYNCQAVVDEEAQVIVSSHVTQETNDKQQLKPAMDAMEKRLNGDKPERMSMDNGYFSEENVSHAETNGIEPLIATGRQKHGEKPLPSPRGRIPKDISVKDRMARKLRTRRGKEEYAKRKQIVEPVFGQIKEARGFRRFLLRGFEQVQSEWDIVCMTHNILKLFRNRVVLSKT